MHPCKLLLVSERASGATEDNLLCMSLSKYSASRNESNHIAWVAWFDFFFTFAGWLQFEWILLCCIIYIFGIQLTVLLWSWHRRSSIKEAMIRSMVVNEERIKLGHWLESVLLCVHSVLWHCWLVTRRTHSLKETRITCPKGSVLEQMKTPIIVVVVRKLICSSVIVHYTGMQLKYTQLLCIALHLNTEWRLGQYSKLAQKLVASIFWATFIKLSD